MLARLSILSLLSLLILPSALAMPFFGFWGGHEDEHTPWPTIKPDYTYAFPTARPTAGPTGTGTGAPWPTDFKARFARKRVERGYHYPTPTWGVFPTGTAGTGTGTGYPYPTATGWSWPKKYD